jgi:3-hydroxybutyryl-CoA dehydrogenase
MKIAIIGTETQQAEWQQADWPNDVSFHFCSGVSETPPQADAVFDLDFSPDANRIAALRRYLPGPVFVNSVLHTLPESHLSFVRINAWPGFIGKQVMEIAAHDNRLSHEGLKVLTAMGKQARLAPDMVGMISPRIISMIVNEAYFALGEGVSTAAEIDIAMKLGTNYPKGPFEWSEQIGLVKIYDLLLALSKENARYEPAEALKKAIHTKKTAIH